MLWKQQGSKSQLCRQHRFPILVDIKAQSYQQEKKSIRIFNLNMGEFIQMCVNSNPAPAPAWPPATSDNCHQYFTQTVTAGHDLMRLRKNPNFSALTDHNSGSTIFHSKRWDPEGKFLTLIWLIAVCVAACWVWAIRNGMPFIQIKLILATGLLQNSPLLFLGLFTDLIPLMRLYFVILWVRS